MNLLSVKMMRRSYKLLVFLIYFIYNIGGVVDAWPKGSVTRYYNFKVIFWLIDHINFKI